MQVLSKRNHTCPRSQNNPFQKSTRSEFSNGLSSIQSRQPSNLYMMWLPITSQTFSLSPSLLFTLPILAVLDFFLFLQHIQASSHLRAFTLQFTLSGALFPHVSILLSLSFLIFVPISSSITNLFIATAAVTTHHSLSSSLLFFSIVTYNNLTFYILLILCIAYLPRCHINAIREGIFGHLLHCHIPSMFKIFF